jgi:hypothetical protein
MHARLGPIAHIGMTWVFLSQSASRRFTSGIQLHLNFTGSSLSELHSVNFSVIWHEDLIFNYDLRFG